MLQPGYVYLQSPSHSHSTPPLNSSTNEGAKPWTNAETTEAVSKRSLPSIHEIILNGQIYATPTPPLTAVVPSSSLSPTISGAQRSCHTDKYSSSQNPPPDHLFGTTRDPLPSCGELLKIDSTERNARTHHHATIRACTHPLAAALPTSNPSHLNLWAQAPVPLPSCLPYSPYGPTQYVFNHDQHGLQNHMHEREQRGFPSSEAPNRSSPRSHSGAFERLDLSSQATFKSAGACERDACDHQGSQHTPGQLPSEQEATHTMGDNVTQCAALKRVTACTTQPGHAGRARELPNPSSWYREEQGVPMLENGSQTHYKSTLMKKRQGRAVLPRRCYSCDVVDTPEWRRGPAGARTLCNACGLQYAKRKRK